MEKVTLNGVEQVKENERLAIRSLIDTHSKDLHYLAFARQLYGDSPLKFWLKNNTTILEQGEKIINDLIEKKEVCSLFPQERLTLYPIEMDDNTPNGYRIYSSKNDESFNLILHYNDDVYKTKYMLVDFDHFEFIKQKDFDIIVASLQGLLKKSKKLQGIYIDGGAYHLV